MVVDDFIKKLKEPVVRSVSKTNFEHDMIVLVSRLKQLPARANPISNAIFNLVYWRGQSYLVANEPIWA
jgi:hypothetical protein